MLARRRGTDNRTLAWVATYRNRPKILELTLKAGGDCNSPACEPFGPRPWPATMCNGNWRRGHATGHCEEMAAGNRAPLVEHGAIDDVFTAAWLGDTPALRCHVDRNPKLVNAIDPVDDFQEVSLLCHAVCGGSFDATGLLLERVRRGEAAQRQAVDPGGGDEPRRSGESPNPKRRRRRYARVFSAASMTQSACRRSADRQWEKKCRAGCCRTRAGRT